MIDWRAHFAKERQIRQCATKAGIPRPRARILAAQLALKPVPREQAARLLMTLAVRKLRT
jgi:hypothetical protein